MIQSLRSKVLGISFMFISLFCFKQQSKAQLPTAPSHIVIVIMENYSYSDIIGNSLAPYINGLVTAGNPYTAVFTKSYAIEHPSQPNYLDFFSGSNQGNTDDNPPAGYPFTTDNLGSELIDAGKSFITYSEDLPSLGFSGVSSGNYVRKHNPAVYWLGTGTHQLPNSVDVPFTSFPTAANYSTLPTISYVIPNEINDMHNLSIPAGDTWLKNKLDTFKQWTIANNSLYIITFDEDDFLGTNNIPTIFIGPMVQGGTYNFTFNHFNVLRTLEDFYSLRHAGTAADSSDILGCWRLHAGVNNVNNTTTTFNVMPNPATDNVYFTSSEPLTQPLNIIITDVLGREMGTYKMNESKTEINTASFVPGVYGYKIVGTNTIINNGKFIINRK